MSWFFGFIAALCGIVGIAVLIGGKSFIASERARIRFVGGCFQMMVIAMIGVAVSPYQLSYDAEADYIRQSEKTDRLQSEQEHDEERFSRLLAQQEAHQERFGKIVEKWEEQATRKDAILEAEEKEAGIERRDSASGTFRD